MTVFAVIPTHNRRERLERCMSLLSDQSEPVVLVVGDGGSSDGTAEMVASGFPQAIYCRGSDEDWWSASINLAIRAALKRCSRNDFVLCMNDDTEVGPTYVAALLAAAGSRTLVGSVAVDVRSPDIIIDGGIRMNWYTAAFHRLNRGRALSEFPAGYRQDVNVLPGRGTLIPAAAFLDLGLFAERALPQYGADYEFAARCERAGYRLTVCYDAVVRSRTEMTGIHGFDGGFSWRRLRHIAVDRRSATNIRDRFLFAWLTRRNPVQGLLFFVLSLGRIIGHHVLELAGGKTQVPPKRR